MTSKTKQYRGPLSSSEIAEGMNAARQNAGRLAKDARLLFDNGRYASAVALAILSIEESGKGPVLRGLAVARDEDELKERWRDYKTHTKKNVMWPLIETFLKGAKRAEDFLPLFYADAEHPAELDQLKQVSVYTDCSGQGLWSVPEQVVDRDLAEVVLQTAEVFTHSREITTEEIDLWIQYMKPSWHDDRLRKQALFEWDKEIRKRGLVVEKESSLTLEKFFVDGISSPKKA